MSQILIDMVNEYYEDEIPALENGIVGVMHTTYGDYETPIEVKLDIINFKELYYFNEELVHVIQHNNDIEMYEHNSNADWDDFYSFALDIFYLKGLLNQGD